jgi:hypothetical protein
VRTRGEGEADERTIEAVLTADGNQTTAVIEERGMPVNLLSAYGAGVQVHVEDLAAHIAGCGWVDAKARWGALEPAYQELAKDVS